MAYQTGTAASPSALRTIIETFATGNGWTLTGGSGGFLSKGQSFVSITPFAINIVTISSITRSGTTATVTTVGAHGLATSDTVKLQYATDSLYNGTFTITFLSTTIFTYTMSGTPSANAVLNQTTFESPSKPSTSSLGIIGMNGNNTGVCPNARNIYVTTASWPVTYYLSYSSTPDQITCTVNYETDKIQMLCFGDIVKIHNSSYVGGNWFFASKVFGDSAPLNLSSITDLIIQSGRGSGTGNQNGAFIPFTGTGDSAVGPGGNTGLHVEIDGNVWSTANATAFLYPVTITDETIRNVFRSPNTWNQQAHLIPIHLQWAATANFMYLGYVEHLRFIRVNNYNIGDIVILGSDKWKVFPWNFKSLTTPNGPGANGSSNSGTLGFAVRYDGP
jgi:hypothetical protein